MASDITWNKTVPEIFILVIGPTGSGKSKFINTLLKSSRMQVGSGLKSCTQKIDYTVAHPPMCTGYRVFLVDTPGFDRSETETSDYETWSSITDYVKARQGTKRHVVAIYLANATENGCRNMINDNMQSFNELYGPEASRAIVFGATRLNRVEDISIRDKYFKSFAGICGKMIQLEEGKQIARYEDTYDSALELIHMVIKLVQDKDGVGIRVDDMSKTSLALKKVAYAVEARRIERSRADPNMERIQKSFWKRNCVIC